MPASSANKIHSLVNGRDSVIQPLRIYYGPEEDNTAVLNHSKVRENTATVPLGDVLPALLDALESNRTWPYDFADDEITISSDLYEVLLAYRHYRRPSA